MKVGIVGNGADKFTERGKQAAFEAIRRVLSPGDTVVSGHSPVGGIDIWAEEVAAELGLSTDIKRPEVHQWNPPGGYGYKARNLDIAASEVVYVILANTYPPEYDGRRFAKCYHCDSSDHVKSGGCWTGKQAIKKGNQAIWIVVEN